MIETKMEEEERDMGRNIGFIGGGSMAEGMIKGMLGSGTFQAEEITVYNRTKERAEYLAQTYGVSGSGKLEEAVRDRDLLILAVSEAGVSEVCQRLKPLMKESTVFASICAGSGIRDYQALLGEDKKIGQRYAKYADRNRIRIQRVLQKPDGDRTRSGSSAAGIGGNRTSTGSKGRDV